MLKKLYYDIGENKAVSKDELIGIFDIDATTISSKTRNYLKKCEENGMIENVSNEIPLSFVLTDKKVYLCGVLSKTIYSRTNKHSPKTL